MSIRKSKFDLYKRTFYRKKEKPYKGRILMNNISQRLLYNTKLSYLILELERIIGEWFTLASYIKKKIAYTVDKDDDYTID
jgi:hypothetical protein